MYRKSMGPWIGCAATILNLSGCTSGNIKGGTDGSCDVAHCEERGLYCGEIAVEGCGLVQCGECQGAERCGGGGVPNVCAADRTPPLVVITAPASGSTVATATVTVSGTASDDVEVSKVEVRVGAAAAYELASGTTSWSRPVTLAPGLNTIYARATDTSENQQETSIVATFASSGPSTVGTNGTTILVNGAPTFVVGMVGICMADAKKETCAESVNRNPNFSYDLFAFKPKSFYYEAETYKQYKNRNIFSSAMYGWAWKDGWDGSTAWFDSLLEAGIANEPNFFGYSLDEPDNSNDVVSRDQLVVLYDYMHSHEPNHPVMVNLCCWPRPINNGVYGLPDYANTADILSWDTYPYSNFFVELGSWTLPDSLYGWEHVAKNPVFHSLNDLDSFGKPVLTVIQANGLVEGNTQVMPDEMIRANTYLAIALGVDGIQYWQYNLQPIPGQLTGLVANQAKNAYIQQLAAEIKSFERFLLMPRAAYSWHYQQDDSSVKLSNNPSKTVGILPDSRHALNYRLIRDGEGDRYYLMVVNKDANAIETNITIQALAGTGALTAKTLGLETTGSPRAGRTLAVTDGQFMEKFDGYAAHIFEIAP